MNEIYEDSPFDPSNPDVIDQMDEKRAEHPSRRQKHYSKITNEKRNMLIDAVENNNEKVTKVAKRLNINYSSAKSILKVYKKEGRSLKKNFKVRMMASDGQIYEDPDHIKNNPQLVPNSLKDLTLDPQSQPGVFSTLNDPPNLTSSKLFLNDIKDRLIKSKTQEGGSQLDMNGCSKLNILNSEDSGSTQDNNRGSNSTRPENSEKGNQQQESESQKNWSPNGNSQQPRYNNAAFSGPNYINIDGNIYQMSNTQVYANKDNNNNNNNNMEQSQQRFASYPQFVTNQAIVMRNNQNNMMNTSQQMDSYPQFVYINNTNSSNHSNHSVNNSNNNNYDNQQARNSNQNQNQLQNQNQGQNQDFIQANNNSNNQNPSPYIIMNNMGSFQIQNQFPNQQFQLVQGFQNQPQIQFQAQNSNQNTQINNSYSNNNQQPIFIQQQDYHKNQNQGQGQGQNQQQQQSQYVMMQVPYFINNQGNNQGQFIPQMMVQGSNVMQPNGYVVNQSQGFQNFQNNQHS